LSDSNQDRFNASLVKWIENYYGPVSEVAGCESPIEQMMFLALSTTASLYGETLQINTQYRIDDYRADFYVRSWEVCSKCKATFERSVIVECDGHDFHERTKEQASRDKKRDRIFQQKGYTVFRFTGSDIWKDVFECAGEVTNFLREQIEALSIDHWISHHQEASAE